MSTPKTTFYDVLGVHKDAPTDEIRRAYRKRALETHPDKLEPSASEEERQATEREFHKVNDAFQTLGDSQKRRRYDAILALRTDPALISEASARRTADREEWARQQKEMIQRRINAFKDEEALRKRQDKVKKEQENLRKEQERLKKEQELKEEAKRREEARERKVADVLQELRNATPELAARKEALLKGAPRSGESASTPNPNRSAAAKESIFTFKESYRDASIKDSIPTHEPNHYPSTEESIAIIHEFAGNAVA
ncbi:hypothetical protein MD484_g5772, partial [Candolleomyces efflorescens]